MIHDHSQIPYIVWCRSGFNFKSIAGENRCQVASGLGLGTWCFSGGKWWMDVEKLMENGPFIGDFPIKTSTDKGVSIAMFQYQTV